MFQPYNNAIFTPKQAEYELLFNVYSAGKGTATRAAPKMRAARDKWNRSEFKRDADITSTKRNRERTTSWLVFMQILIQQL